MLSYCATKNREDLEGIVDCTIASVLTSKQLTAITGNWPTSVVVWCVPEPGAGAGLASAGRTVARSSLMNGSSGPTLTSWIMQSQYQLSSRAGKMPKCGNM